MKHYILGACLMVAVSPCASAGVVFFDDFNRTLSGPDYITTVSAGDGGVVISGGAFLELHNGTGVAAGRVSVASPLSGFDAPFSGRLTDNTGLVTWEVNLRYNRTTNPAGFSAGNYGLAWILAGSQGDFTGGKGYAVAYGNTGTPDPIRLVRYDAGLTTQATLIASVANDLAAVNNYASVRVTYDPNSEEWALYVRDDGASAWADPASLDAGSLKGVATDASHTGSALTQTGFLWNHSTATGQTAQFDNLSVSLGAGAVPEPAWGASLAVGALGLAVSIRRRRLRRCA